MTGQLGNIAFVIWRESVEALLVIGILNAWLIRQSGEAARGRLFLWAGVAAGFALAVLFGFVLIAFGEALSDETQRLYQAGAVLLAAGLIVQMVFWMRRHGRTLKRDLETSLQKAADQANWWGVFTLALLAVSREGSETVVFLYGTVAAAHGGALLPAIAAAAVGLVAAIGTYWLLQVGSRLVSWRLFFSVTEMLLLFLAASLLLSGVDALIDLGWLPALSGRLWDSSAILSDNGGLGGLIGALTGYRATPDLMQLLVYALYWIAIAFALSASRPAAKAAG